jgi:hypothetical protein
MEKRGKVLKRKTYYVGKIRKAAHLLFYRHHRKPGVMGWELRRRLGSEYPKVLNLLKSHLENLGFQIKVVFKEKVSAKNPTLKQMDQARFYVTLKDGLEPEELRLMGWRIDDIAGLAIAISYITSNGGKASRKEIVDILRDKLPGWRTEMNLRLYVKSGYLAEDKDGQLFLDWRTRAEINQKKLVDVLLSNYSNPPNN